MQVSACRTPRVQLRTLYFQKLSTDDAYAQLGLETNAFVFPLSRYVAFLSYTAVGYSTVEGCQLLSSIHDRLTFWKIKRYLILTKLCGVEYYYLHFTDE